MRRGLALAALLLPLGGCVVPPSAPYGYGYPGSVPPGYPGSVPAYGPDYNYPGYAYNEGSPTLFYEGATFPLIFYGGGWGFWDRDHRWHGAPEGVGRSLEMRHPGGVGYRPWGGGQFGRPEGPGFVRPGGGFPDAGYPGGFPGERPGSGERPGFRPGGEPPRGAFTPGGVPPGGFHPGGPHPLVRPGGFRPGAPAARLHPAGGFTPAARPTRNVIGKTSTIDTQC